MNSRDVAVLVTIVMALGALALLWGLAGAPGVAGAHPGVRQGSTGYCLRGRMADGSYTRPGSVAHNGFRLGTKLTISPSPTGRRFFVVRDRIGYGTQLDFWTPSCARARAWGRHAVTVQVGWHRR